MNPKDFNPPPPIRLQTKAPSTVSEAEKLRLLEQGIDEHDLDFELDEDMGGNKKQRGNLSIEVNAYTKPRKGRKETRRKKQKQRMVYFKLMSS